MLSRRKFLGFLAVSPIAVRMAIDKELGLSSAYDFRFGNPFPRGFSSNIQSVVLQLEKVRPFLPNMYRDGLLRAVYPVPRDPGRHVWMLNRDQEAAWKNIGLIVSPGSLVSDDPIPS